MRRTSDTSTQTICDCDTCMAYTLTVHIQRTTSAVQAAGHHEKAAADGWSDWEGRDYCPGCPPGLPVEEHDHDGLWAADDETAA
ncbi:hypothetical protein [Streptomyces nymphaeiformis]|uniref:Uncharacterized protein n=1 Tax=Streptomyces nymphaeiformis TaxID=2663842 RepID=A0A7W7XF16_9ACTN|nr:hypothetical protein [Streptomyces nymphaeiformis]MBB4984976.1 hypothetical protein [Streptomyces nymphaeiformis]